MARPTQPTRASAWPPPQTQGRELGIEGNRPNAPARPPTAPVVHVAPSLRPQPQPTRAGDSPLPPRPFRGPERGRGSLALDARAERPYAQRMAHLRLAFSPDSDDIFMFWPLLQKQVSWG